MATVALDDGVHGGETEARAARARREVGVEDLGDVLRCNSVAGIGYCYANVATRDER